MRPRATPVTTTLPLPGLVTSTRLHPTTTRTLTYDLSVQVRFGQVKRKLGSISETSPVNDGAKVTKSRAKKTPTKAATKAAAKWFNGPKTEGDSENENHEDDGAGGAAGAAVGSSAGNDGGVFEN
jgi:hypothetical protein